MINSENNIVNAEDYSIILTTIDTNQKAKKIAHKLIELHLVACVQIDKICSIYFWKHNICKSNEYRLMIKTMNINYEKVEQVIRQFSNYDNPQVVQLKLTNGSNEYLNWISDSCKKKHN
ncbi:cutA1 divalent ion tolerance family protein [Orientia chuto str. Dubai]|uniref:CutA1 divalent ion tolerance family protein n=1 Tax=Orientia chuto str. Dubai TaxID=1359168 RepID=A0A0F3MSE9_9RICK|nr:divalent-cation tolerance protein CutA [Candidatus Orientia mediorientalis]KJV57539.1 cutA1 divalent ion tolerance family protein [Orientia chuto str. Dubai]